MRTGANPTWRFIGDPAYSWVDLGPEIIYTDTPVEGSSHVDGISPFVPGNPPSQWNAIMDDLYNRVGFVKNQSDLTGNRGYAKNITINASRALTIDDNGLIGVWTADLGASQPDIVELTLPTRLEMTDAGLGYLLRTATAPFLGPVGKNIPSFIIQGYQTNAGVPLKITVAQPTVVAPGVDVDFQQSIVIGSVTGQSIWLYTGEYAEIRPLIIKDDATGTWFCNWTVVVHYSGYHKIGQYVQHPTGIVPLNTLRANNASKSRALYPRLWAALAGSGTLSAALVAQGSKTNDKFGDGDGSTTFTLPNLAALEAGLVNWCLYY